MRHIPWLLFPVLLTLPNVALAHAAGLPVAPSDLWHHWTFDPFIWAPMLCAHWLYGRGLLRLWARAGIGKAIPVWRAVCFVAGEAVLVAALIAPLDALGETLLSAHMIQHLLLTSVAPAMLILGNPSAAWLWSLPRSWRKAGRHRFVAHLRQLLAVLTRPLIATVIYGGMLWLWHIPVFFDAALRDDAIHTAEHISFLVSGLIFWQATSARSSSPLGSAMLILLTFVHMGALAAILVVAPAPLYAYDDRTLLWSLEPIEDQQLAGLIMWAPAGLFYLGAFAVVAARALPEEEPSLRLNHGTMRAKTSSPSMK